MMRAVALSIAMLLAAGAIRGQSMSEITVEQAYAIAQQEIAKSAHRFVILTDRTEEHPFGWVFSYAPAAYLQSRNPTDLVPGVGPLVVERNGKITYLSTAVTPRLAINAFLEKWRKQHGR
jgi:hypothetical protein